MSRTPSGRNTVVISAVVDYRELAELIIWAKENGHSFRNRSSLIREIVHIFHDLLAVNGKLPVAIPDERVMEVLEHMNLHVSKKNLSTMVDLSMNVQKSQMNVDEYYQYQKMLEIQAAWQHSPEAQARVFSPPQAATQAQETEVEIDPVAAFRQSPMYTEIMKTACDYKPPVTENEPQVQPAENVIPPEILASESYKKDVAYVQQQDVAVQQAFSMEAMMAMQAALREQHQDVLDQSEEKEK